MREEDKKINQNKEEKEDNNRRETIINSESGENLIY